MNDDPRLDLFVSIEAPANGRLEQLQGMYPHIKAKADAAAAELKAVVDGIKSELLNTAPEDAHSIELLGVPRLRLTYVERWTLDTDKLKKENPVLYVKYARHGGSWTLRKV